MKSVPQANFFEEVVQKVELKIKGELGIPTDEQIELSKDVKMTVDCFADWLILLESKIKYLERSCATNSSQRENTEDSTYDFATLRYDDNKLMEARKEIGTDVDLCFTRVADQLGGVEI